MISLGSLFHPSPNAQASSLSELLANPETTLQCVLDDDNFISEFRCGSLQIRQFMTYKRMQQMVQLVTQLGDPADKKRSYKFPLTAADLLSGQAAFVIDMLLPEEGAVVEEEKMVSPVERQIQQQLEEVDDDLDLSSSESSHEEKPEQAKSQQQACGKEEEEFGEFVPTPVRQKRIVKVKEIVQSESMVKKEYPGLVSELLQYFSNPINYTLTAYCCKILTSLLNKRTSKFLARLFQNKHQAQSILAHIESRSTVELLTRLFTIQTADYLQERLRLFRKMVQSSSQPQELNVMSNVSATICETLQKISANSKSISPCNDLQVYLRSIPQMFEIVISNVVSSHETVSMYSVGILFAFLNSLPPELDSDAIDITLFRFVDGALKKLKEAVGERRSRLGVGRVRMFQLLNFVLKRSLIQEYLSKQEIFPIIFSIIRTYPLNNILHSEAFRFIAASLTAEPPLAKNLLKGTDFIDWLSLQAQEENEKASKKGEKGYGGHLLNLCKKLKQLSGSNPFVLEFINHPRFSNVWKILVDRPTQLNEFDLGGYASHRITKLQVLNNREEILKHYSSFLTNAHPPVFQNEGDYLHPILLEELQRQLDGVQFESENESRSQEVIEQQKHKAELIEENEEYMSAFWKIHLSYNVENLIEEVL